MNVEGEQNASGAPASPPTASTAAVQQAPQITSFFQLERTSPTQATPATSPPAAAADLPAAAEAGTNIYHTPKRTLWVVGRAITPPGLSHPLGTAATCTLSTGLHKIPHPPQDTTPGDNIFKRSNVSPGVCYLV